MMRSPQLLFTLFLIMSTTLTSIPCMACDTRDEEQIEFFETKIRPVLVKNCYGCHSSMSGKARGGLTLDTREGTRAGGDSGEAVVAGTLEDGTLWSAINYEDWDMPPGRQLKDREIADIKEWIMMGAPDPRKTKIGKVNSTITSKDIRNAKKNFWAFSKPRMPETPEVTNSYWAKNDIDYFVLNKLHENDLQPAMDAASETFLRRLCFDLTGIPPTPQQVQWFASEWAKDQDQAIDHVVRSLLKSEQYGERWGRHWLDVARYAESAGKEFNATFDNAWRYRDYVIDSFNDDKPYDQFIREQIAGDLLPVKTDEQWAKNLTATGFLALGPKTLLEQNGRQFEMDLIDEQIDTSTRVILGLSVACARCHDHKFDPIPQTDYYAMAGIFKSTNTYFGTGSVNRNRRPSALIELPIDDPNPNSVSIPPNQIAGMKDDLAELRLEYTTLQRNRRLAARGLLFIDGKKISQNDPQLGFRKLGRVSGEIAQLDNRIKSVNDQGEPASYCMGVQEKPNASNARVLIRGELNQPAQEVPRGFVQVIPAGSNKIKPDSSGRLELAKWMSDERNPLTARVMVNRIWLHLFGTGIVGSPENFGATGQAPTHPELLDHLAVKFMDSGWSVKSLISEIVKSRAYRMNSNFDQAKFEIDPDNEFLWRANPRRLDAEAIRDAMLAISNEIDLRRPRGSQVSQDSNQVRSFRGATRTWDESVKYRSVYLPVMRDNLPRILSVFDFAEPSIVIGKRETSNTPRQALYMMNNSIVIDQSEAFAQRLIESHSDSTEQIKNGFLLAFGRPATAEELASSLDFFDTFDSEGRSKTNRHRMTLQVFCQALFASAEFRYIN